MQSGMRATKGRRVIVPLRCDCAGTFRRAGRRPRSRLRLCESREGIVGRPAYSRRFSLTRAALPTRSRR